MEDLKSLAEDIAERKLKRARTMTTEEKILAGPRLFKLSCEAVKAGLRIDHPEADEREIHKRLIERVYGNRNSRPS